MPSLAKSINFVEQKVERSEKGFRSTLFLFITLALSITKLLFGIILICKGMSSLLLEKFCFHPNRRKSVDRSDVEISKNPESGVFRFDKRGVRTVM